MKRWAMNIVLLACFFLTVTSGQDTLRKAYPPAPFLTAHDSVLAIQRLRSGLEQIFSSKVYRNTKASVYVWSSTRKTILYERNCEQCLTPASTTKLFSSVAAYHALGKGGTIDTEVRATGKLDAQGTLHGDVYMVGHGDALLSVNDVEQLADMMYDAGIKHVTGNVIGDGSFFDANTNRTSYSGDLDDVQVLAPITALGINRNSLALVVSASSKGIVTAQTIPSSDAIIIQHSSAPAPRVRSKKGRKGRRARAVRLSASTSPSADGKQIITYVGAPGRNRTSTIYVRMISPPTIAAGTLATRMRSGGIAIDGTVKLGKAPQNSRVVATFKRPLVEYTSIVNKRSDNFLAEHLFKIVGGLYGGQNNTAQRAKEMVLVTLDSLGVDREGCTLNDGSGLSRRNLVCARTEAMLLDAVAKMPYGAEFKQTLSIASVDGTLRGRMTKTPAHANVQGKTGSLRNTSALAGYVTTLDGEQLVFSVISNGPYAHAYKGAENKVGVLLASFSYDKSKSARDQESKRVGEPESKRGGAKESELELDSLEVDSVEVIE